VGLKRQGQVVGVCLSKRKNDPKINVGRGVLKPGFGLIGDSHAGTEKEISLLGAESIRRLCCETGLSAGPGCFAENITTEGIDLTSFSIGSRLLVGPATLEVIQIGKDPSQAHTYHFQGYSILPKEGIFCKVIEGGEINVGDTIEVLEGHQELTHR
jgi:MOSC domain-containing protein YiiM